MHNRVDYDEGLHAVYERGRVLPPETVATWMAALERNAPTRRPLTVLDLGSGTGRFSDALADTFGGPVHGVEPSARMREVAAAAHPHPRVTYSDGRAEAIPLPDNSCDLAVMFLVLHHVEHRTLGVKELARVLRPGARLCVHSGFSGQMHDHVWYRFFPRARQVDDMVFPRLDEVIAQFAEAGLRYVTLDHVDQQVAASLPAYFERFRHRSFSTLQHMSEEEIAEGMAAMQAAARRAEGAPPEPVIQTADMLVLERVDA
ncbi:class I SAM-dependent methyltransferase [Kutzneria buriramensis]|uniref:Ubiquinone/menaquinone biosynthesis C-methylase UbiE n=1 Tax=Kutzneria buriramensis TaxID=1045776 RepID=A0A3E0HLX2_9PSEU|nr:class I SAM-dependent methyltransferase [Kutzneria buriramensis]REH47216.1 ubiquinone/menaquinone biosynthesis C-methylase UbiE [Kutzneria buriramensis]